MNKVYLVIEDYSSDYEHGNIIRCFGTYDKAKEYFDKIIEDYKRNDMLFDEVEEDIDSFSTYESGYYSQNHNDLSIEVHSIL